MCENGKQESYDNENEKKESYESTKMFTLSNGKHSGDYNRNRFFLEQVRSHMNDILDMKGFLLLNTIYSALGFPETAAGAIMGWIKENCEVGFDLFTFGSPHYDSFWVTFYPQGIIFNEIDRVVSLNFQYYEEY